MPISRMPFFSASAIHSPYRRRDIGSPGSTRIGLPPGSPATSRHSSRPPPTGTIVVSTLLDTNGLPLARSGKKPDVVRAVDAADHARRLSAAVAGDRHRISAPPPAAIRDRVGSGRPRIVAMPGPTAGGALNHG